MSDFDARWQDLVRRARSAAALDATLDAAHVDRLAQLARRAPAGLRESALSWRSLALAASLFLAALVGLGLGAQALGLAPQIDSTLADLARLPRQVPDTTWMPAPPDISFLGAPQLRGASPASWFEGLDRILSPRNAAEIHP